jgi:hypothetical protein
MIIVVDTDEGKKSITVKDCRGGRAIWNHINGQFFFILKE